MTSITALPPALAGSRSVPPNQAPLNNLPSHLPAFSSNASSNSADTNDKVPRGPARVALNFYRPPQDGSEPFNYVEKPPAGMPQRNFGDWEAQVSLADARGQESGFSLEKHAFMTLQDHPHNPEIDWNDDDSIKRVYYPEVEKILMSKVRGAERVLLFDHTIRRATPEADRSPVTRAHIDQTPASAATRVRHHLPEEANRLLQGRYRIINVWRPLNGPVESFPLAFADSSSVPDSDMIGVQHRYPDRTGETASVKFNDQHKWYYWSGVENDERILLQCYDSAEPSNRVPHSAFVDPRSAKESRSRESIEVRALVFG